MFKSFVAILGRFANPRPLPCILKFSSAYSLCPLIETKNAQQKMSLSLTQFLASQVIIPNNGNDQENAG